MSKYEYGLRTRTQQRQTCLRVGCNQHPPCRQGHLVSTVGECADWKTDLADWQQHASPSLSLSTLRFAVLVFLERSRLGKSLFCSSLSLWCDPPFFCRIYSCMTCRFTWVRLLRLLFEASMNCHRILDVSEELLDCPLSVFDMMCRQGDEDAHCPRSDGPRG